MIQPHSMVPDKKSVFIPYIHHGFFGVFEYEWVKGLFTYNVGPPSSVAKLVNSKKSLWFITRKKL